MTAPKFWWSVTVPDLPNREAITRGFFRLGCTGTRDHANGLIAYFDHTSFDSESKLRDGLRAVLGDAVIQIDRTYPEDWENEWKKNFKPRKISRRFVVRPSWETYRKKKNEIELVIDPKMSFGTGTHETTQLMLRLMETSNLKDRVVLDVGTGTGILAIATVKLGAKKVYGVDVEEPSFENARENRKRNGCVPRMSVALADVVSLPMRWPKRFDAILANIQRAVFEKPDVMNEIRKRLKPTSQIFISGILSVEDPIMRRLFSENDLSVKRYKKAGEWVAYELRCRRG